jgi:hypothetical protein
MSEFYRDVQIIVTDGEGQEIIDDHGHISRTIIDAPGNGATYDLLIFDKDNKPLAGRTGLVDDIIFVEEIPLYHLTTFKIFNSSEDGTYSIRVWGQRW